ncbi:TlpA family protein disulfide reductase [Paenibacillus aquistagni]|uniref:TlpA family protein disulfide reductase n=1 Tax=Paenibacillus aquistagni TaxID=1852522 RepID=UPI000B5114A7|nr:TlpA disulfide reductase family protein [Paenibacillus aquistagni]
MKKRAWMLNGMLLVLGLAAIYFIIASQAAKTESVYEDISLKELATGREVQIQYADKPTVLLMFTSWCPYCNEDAPKIVALEEKYRDRLQVYGVNLLYQDEVSELESYVDRHQSTYPVLMDETGDMHRKYGRTGFPALFFLNKQGEVVDQILGSTDMETIEASFLRLLEKEA